MVCPFLRDNNCGLIEDLEDRKVPVTNEICTACSKSPNPHRINLVTLSLTSERKYDILKLGNGFGTRLHNLIAPFISESKDCQCPGHRDILDLWTPEYIECNIHKVVGWLATEAAKRKIPFSYKVTKIILLQLIYQERQP